jgi:hypothetical protein
MIGNPAASLRLRVVRLLGRTPLNPNATRLVEIDLHSMGSRSRYDLYLRAAPITAQRDVEGRHRGLDRTDNRCNVEAPSEA